MSKFSVLSFLIGVVSTCAVVAGLELLHKSTSYPSNGCAGPYVLVGDKVFDTRTGVSFALLESENLFLDEVTTSTMTISGITIPMTSESLAEYVLKVTPEAMEVWESRQSGNLQLDQELYSSCAPVNHEGYTYTVVQIGEQCWFAENLRSEVYLNGDSILRPREANTWSELTSRKLGLCQFPGLSKRKVDSLGLHYNSYAISDSRALCPSGWHVSTDEDWLELEHFLGMPMAEAMMFGERGSSDSKLGLTLQSEETAPGNIGFGAKIGGTTSIRRVGSYYDAEYGFNLEGPSKAVFWAGNGRIRSIDSGISRSSFSNDREGASVRCVLN